MVAITVDGFKSGLQNVESTAEVIITRYCDGSEHHRSTLSKLVNVVNERKTFMQRKQRTMGSMMTCSTLLYLESFSTMM